ncbi:MAG: hypothetical protein JOY89_07390 [Solirubrobacterales bacterium]|nr:hypothetical protein [Solirubrobacterales bacterium]
MTDSIRMISKGAKSPSGVRKSVSRRCPLCFMHVPKSGGTSVHDALLAALPEGSVSPKRIETRPFKGLDELPHPLRELVVAEERDVDAMSRSGVVSGHFCLHTLMRVAPPESIATVLREPRSRLLSLYAFWRLTPGWDERLNPGRPYDHALRALDEFLAEPQIAPAVDNAVCRILLSGNGDPRIPEFDFISPEHLASVAADAIDRLDQLGFVGVLEHGQGIWEGLSRFFGVRLEPTRENMTASAGDAGAALPIQEPISCRTLDLFNARTAADALVYTHALMPERSEVEARRIRNSSFAAQLVRLGDIAGSSAASARSLGRLIGETESRLAGLAEELSRRDEQLSSCREALNAQKDVVGRLQDDLASYRNWLEGIQRSASWRLTSPLRAAKRRVLGAKR